MTTDVPSVAGVEDELLSAEQAAKVRGCSARHLRRLASSGLIPATILGSGAYVFRRADIDPTA